MEKKKIEKKWIFLMLVVTVCVVLMIIAVSTADKELLFDGAIDSADIRLIIIFIVAISIALIALIAVLAMAKPEEEKITANIQAPQISD